MKVKIQNTYNIPFDVVKGTLARWWIPSFLFIIALNTIIKEVRIEKQGTIYNKEQQIITSGDDIDIIRWSTQTVTETCKELKEKPANVGMRMNVEQTNYYGNVNGEGEMGSELGCWM